MKRKPNNPTTAAFLAQHHACSDGAAFAMQYPTMADVWDNCKRPDWLLWILDRLNMPLDKDRRLFACWCAVCTPMANGQTTRSLLTDPRSLEAVRVATRHALGKATDAELAAARAAARDAAGTAARDAAGTAARDAARDAAGTAARDAAGTAARDAAWAAAGAAARDAAWAAAGDAARDAAWAAAGDAAWVAARAAQCVQLRTLVPNPFR